MRSAIDSHSVSYGGIVLRVSSNVLLRRPPAGSKRYSVFSGVDDVTDGAFVSVDVSRQAGVIPPGATRVFDAGAWQAWRAGEETWYVLGAGGGQAWTVRLSPPGAEPHVSIFRTGEHSIRNAAEESLPHPLAYPIDQILLMHLLPRFGGILIHAAGFVRPDGAGVVCAGRSGAGKTTLSLTADRAGWRVLSDDRVVMRRVGDGFRIFGTPWPGDGGFARNESAELAALRFIVHARNNALAPLRPFAAAARLFPVCSIPWYDQSCADRCLELLDRLVSTVPCADLECTPDERALEALLDPSPCNRAP